MAEFPKKLDQKLEKRAESNSLRRLKKSRDLVDFTSNDYLGFSRNKKIESITQKILSSQGFQNGSTGSRLLSGNHKLYSTLENLLAEFHNAPSALVFNSGYDANIGFFSSVPQRNDIVFYDELCHASIRDGIQMGHAKAYKFRHNDLDDLSCHIERISPVGRQGRNKDSRVEIYIITESVFSMDGDTPDVSTLATFCSEKNLYLVVDEAHATGIFGKGRGLVGELGLESDVFARIVTFGKALGGHGAAILGAQQLKSYLVNFARSFIYTTALPPHTVATAMASYDFLATEGAKFQFQLFENIAYFKNKAKELKLTPLFLASDSAIQSAIIPGNEHVKSISKVLLKAGFDVRPILSPTVPRGQERLRICLHAFNKKSEIDTLLNVIAENKDGK